MSSLRRFYYSEIRTDSGITLTPGPTSPSACFDPVLYLNQYGNPLANQYTKDTLLNGVSDIITVVGVGVPSVTQVDPLLPGLTVAAEDASAIRTQQIEGLSVSIAFKLWDATEELNTTHMLTDFDLAPSDLHRQFAASLVISDPTADGPSDLRFPLGPGNLSLTEDGGILVSAAVSSAIPFKGLSYNAIRAGIVFNDNTFTMFRNSPFIATMLNDTSFVVSVVLRLITSTAQGNVPESSTPASRNVVITPSFINAPVLRSDDQGTLLPGGPIIPFNMLGQASYVSVVPDSAMAPVSPAPYNGAASYLTNVYIRNFGVFDQEGESSFLVGQAPFFTLDTQAEYRILDQIVSGPPGPV